MTFYVKQNRVNFKKHNPIVPENSQCVWGSKILFGAKDLVQESPPSGPPEDVID